ncbi:hypothetical protein Rsub_08876 [Raphidocelis subcapitata]|uniref:Uncharacterized protein n=1 Tax=Raphidocelis subcapitata TaxID=307507 RepID=A0A2V0P8D7_9CHLO|nr:hypothetical protein Rsub_08876 [Raphidocelis subcapitata]|eukprot:GBF96128.1 hypothetical protein Rsub_08876 [Raphidocelis subcapitata]
MARTSAARALVALALAAALLSAAAAPSPRRMLRGMAVSNDAAMLSTASAQGNEADAVSTPRGSSAVASNGAGVKATANTDWDFDKDDDMTPTGQSGARNLGYGDEPDFSTDVPAPAKPTITMASAPRRLSEVVRRMLGSKLSDSAARVASASASGNSASAQSVKGALLASASNGRVSADAGTDWAFDKEGGAGSKQPLGGEPAWGETSWGRRRM